MSAITTEQVRAAEAISAALAAFGLPAFGTGVAKTGAGYSGPGVICGVAIAEDGSPRVVVAHQIEGVIPPFTARDHAPVHIHNG